MFACLEKFSEENNIKLEEEIKTKIIMHLTSLKQDLVIRFPDTLHGDQWIINPFTCDLNTVKMNLKEKEQLIDLLSDESLRSIFKTTDLSKFWIMMEKEYPLLYNTSLLKLLPFASTYLCKTAFSTFTAIKTKYSSRLNVETDLRVSLSNNISPRINILTASVEAQCSHYFVNLRMTCLSHLMPS
ncbi:zinc finger BED domain-containing protein 5-like [Diabrotica undecimpunctata]|uniref:zinc finger BED domain-containing protein 5-like n=1 Tax=Diabrotica undecimpunctata TaxID=50387 RepID=UPI003B636E23